MRLEQIFYFIEIIKCNNISQAARNLFISQPALSSTIKDLEQELGQQLLVRTSKGVQPTDVGEKVYHEALQIQSTLQGWYRPKEVQTEYEGVVHICALPAVARHLSINVLLPLKKLYPKLSVHIHDVRPQSVISELKKNVSNIAISTVIPGNSCIIEQAAEQAWTSVHLFDDRRFLFMSKENPLSESSELTEQDLRVLPLIYYSLPNDMVSSTYEHFFKSSLRVAAKEDVLDLVCRDEGVFIQPFRLNASDFRMRNGQMVAKEIPIRSINHTAPVYMIHTNKLSATEQFLVSYIENHFLSSIDTL